jgi:hypothetical protein
LLLFWKLGKKVTMSANQPELRELDQVESLSELLHIGKDEMNLVEFPMTSLSDRPAIGETSLKFEDQIYDDRKKKLITRKRVIEGSKEYGLPTATDDTVILGLIQLTKVKNGFASREVEFTRHELISLLHWPNKGQSYDRIDQSLHRLAAVTYHFENSWWDNRRKAWTTKIFGIIDTVELNDSRENDGQGGLFTSRIHWNQVILDSFQAGYLRTIDFQLALSLTHAISMRIYRFMGKRFHLRSEWTFDLKDFAYEHIGLSRNYEGGTQIARKLQPALDELEKVGFLEPLDEDERFIKKGRVWTIRLAQKRRALPAAANDDTSVTPHLVGELIGRGMTAATAIKLVEGSPAELIERQLEYFDWLIGRKPEKIGQPGGYLVDAIKKDYAAPKGFISRAERQKSDEERQAKSHQADIERRQKQQAAAEEQADRAAFDAYVKQLSKAERADLEAKALAAASEESRAGYNDPAVARFRSTLMAGMLREYLLPILRDQAPPKE